MMQQITLAGDALQGYQSHLYHVASSFLPTTVYMGRIRPRTRPPMLYLGDYLLGATGELPPLPIEYYKQAMASIQRMYGNDREGCCVMSSAYHQAGLWTGNDSGTPVVGTDEEVHRMYQKVCGPGDRGCNIEQVLEWTRVHGLPFNGVIHKIEGYVALNWTDWRQLLVALDIFGTVKLGINLPDEWRRKSIWAPTNSPIVGGHDVPIVGAEEDGVVISSWARLFKITKEATVSRRWLEEAYAVLSPDWYAKAKASPHGLNAETLRADLQKLKNGEIPPIDPEMQPWENILP